MVVAAYVPLGLQRTDYETKIALITEQFTQQRKEWRRMTGSMAKQHKKESAELQTRLGLIIRDHVREKLSQYVDRAGYTPLADSLAWRLWSANTVVDGEGGQARKSSK